MLGNGRPFVIEVLEAKEAPTQAVMQIAMDFVSSGSGLNVDNDVNILILEEVSTEWDILSCHLCLTPILLIFRRRTKPGQRCNMWQKRREKDIHAL